MLNIHETVYKLSADPFRLSPDPRFSYSHRSYARAKAYLDYALLQGEGFIMITGAPGTGKTTLISEILEGIDEALIKVATLTSTQLRTRDLLQMVATSFGLRFKDADKATLLTVLEQSLRQQRLDRRNAVLIVDEAQGLSIGALEELRLLANLQHENQLLLQVFLIGQEPLRELVSLPRMEQLRQRIIASSHLEPLSLDDTVSYIQHRLVQAGWQGDPEIDSDALQLIHKYSGGIPRRINLICTRLLLSGAMADKHAFGGQDAREVILELQQEMLIDPDNADTKIDVAADSRASIRAITRKNVFPDADKPGQGSPSSGDSEPADNIEQKERPLSTKPSNGSNAVKVSSRNSAPNRKRNRRSEDQKRGLSDPVDHEIKAALEDDTAQAREEQVQKPPSSRNVAGRIGQTGQNSPVANRSISMAAARAAPISEGRKPYINLTPRPSVSGSPKKFVASSPGSDGRKPAVKSAKRKARSLSMLGVIFLLAVGPLAAVVGVNFRDYVITVSVQADKEGVIRGVMSDFKHTGDKSEELVDQRISKQPTQSRNVTDSNILR